MGLTRDPLGKEELGNLEVTWVTYCILRSSALMSLSHHYSKTVVPTWYYSTSKRPTGCHCCVWYLHWETAAAEHIAITEKGIKGKYYPSAVKWDGPLQRLGRIQGVEEFGEGIEVRQVVKGEYGGGISHSPNNFKSSISPVPKYREVLNLVEG